jgi:TatD DNase family protein
MIFLEQFYLNFHAHNQKAEEGELVIQSKFLQEDLIAQPSDKIFFTSGLHPWHADKLDIGEIKKRLEKLIELKFIIAIGETGIDKLKGPEIHLQTEVFKAHIGVAEKYGLPIIVHSVKAHNEILKLKTELNSKVPWVIHHFNGSKQIAFDLIDHGFYLSLSYHITQTNSKLSEYLHTLPLDSIFLETDDFNIDIKNLYKSVSLKYNISIDSLKEQLIKNFKNLLNGK